MITIAVLFDTHGLLRPEIPSAIKDVDHIIHAGDLGKMEILDELNGIAPTNIVRGNVDTGAWAASLPYDTVVEIAGHPHSNGGQIKTSSAVKDTPNSKRKGPAATIGGGSKRGGGKKK